MNMRAAMTSNPRNLLLAYWTLLLSGIQTGTDYRWYDLSAKTPNFNNKDKKLVLQYTVKHEQSLDCGGGYIKLAPEGVDQSKWGGDSDYSIMFGPDICGYSTKKVHVIFTYKGKNHCELTHSARIVCHRDGFTERYHKF